MFRKSFISVLVSLALLSPGGVFAQSALGTISEVVITAPSPFTPIPHPTMAEVSFPKSPVVQGVAKAVPKAVLCQCVLYLRQVLGVDVHGNAWDIAPNVATELARVGDVLLMDYDVGHAALITHITEPEANKIYLTIAESNFHHCTPGTRVVALSDYHIRGIYRPA